MFLLPILGLALLALVWFVFVYNRIVRLRNRADEQWADIDVELRRRHNLVDNLVGIVRGYAAHERGTLDEVTEARGKAVALTEGPGGDGGRGPAEGALAQALRRLFALSERYPNLKADQNFQELSRSLEELERAIETARIQFNDAVRRHNVYIEQFPNSLVAGMAGVSRRSFFAAGAEDRETPEAHFA